MVTEVMLVERAAAGLRLEGIGGGDGGGGGGDGDGGGAGGVVVGWRSWMLVWMGG